MVLLFINWYYYSLNGTGDGERPYGDSKNPDIGTYLGKGDDVQSLVKKASIINPAPGETHNYDRFVRVKTTPEEDKLMKAKAAKVASAKKYKVIGCSCVDVQKDALEALVNSRVGWRHKLIIGEELTTWVPNNFISRLPSAFQRLNSNMRMFGDENVFIKRTIKLIIEPGKLQDISEGEYYRQLVYA